MKKLYQNINQLIIRALRRRRPSSTKSCPDPKRSDIPFEKLADVAQIFVEVPPRRSCRRRSARVAFNGGAWRLGRERRSDRGHGAGRSRGVGVGGRRGCAASDGGAAAAESINAVAGGGHDGAAQSRRVEAGLEVRGADAGGGGELGAQSGGEVDACVADAVPATAWDDHGREEGG